jgi:serine/threonine protein kinase
MTGKFGPYVLVGQLGEGMTGKVYQALDPLLERMVALKVLDKKWLAYPSIVARFRLEAQASARLAHPNVVRLYHAGEAEGTYFLAMEYVEGSNLYRLVEREGPLAVPRACKFIRQAALGLQHVHDLGYVLRDVKPSNLMAARPAEEALPRSVRLPAAGEIVKVIDLSIVRRKLGGCDDTWESLTAPGVFLGTPDYTSPEQARNPRRADARSDLYSLGAAFYYLLTGAVPFPGGSAAAKLSRHTSPEKPPPVQELRPEVPPAVAAVVLHLMAKRPEDRYQTAAEVAAALARCPQSLGRREAAAL